MLLLQVEPRVVVRLMTEEQEQQVEEVLELGVGALQEVVRGLQVI